MKKIKFVMALFSTILMSSCGNSAKDNKTEITQEVVEQTTETNVDSVMVEEVDTVKVQTDNKNE